MKLRICIGSLACLFILTGCSDINAYMSELVTDKLIQKISGDEDYEKYLSLKEEGMLTEDGYYSNEDVRIETDLPDTTGKVHVTFAENVYLSVTYYYDAELTHPIDVSTCYLDAEDCIYASAPVVRDSSNPAYRFSGFRVWKYDSNGKRTGEISADNTEKNLVIKIPEDTSVTELSIEPVGFYEDKVLSLKDYCLDEKGNRQELTGTWKINEETYTGNTAEISSVIPYTVQYQYDEREYFFVASTPDCFSYNDSGGEVNFYKSAGLYADNCYSVELHPYIDAVIDTDEFMPMTIKVNGKEQSLPVTLDKLRFGDTVTIETSSAYKTVCDQIQLPEPERLNDGYRFTLTVPENVSELHMTVKKWTSKVIPFDVPKNSSDNLWEQILDLFASSQAEDTLLTVKNGNNVFTYKDLKNGKTVAIHETETLEIIVGEEIRNSPNLAFLISVNGTNPVSVSAASEEKSLSFSYDEIESVKITVEKGFVFSSAHIDNGELEVQYLVNGEPVKEGQFLPEGTRVIVKVTDCPENIEITGGAVQAGLKSGSVMIQADTKSADFVVNFQSTDNP